MLTEAKAESAEGSVSTSQTGMAAPALLCHPDLCLAPYTCTESLPWSVAAQLPWCSREGRESAGPLFIPPSSFPRDMILTNLNCK